MNIGDRIKEERELRGLSQAELAEKMGYKSKTSIHKIETGITDLPLSKVEEFAKVLNTTPGQLMGWDSKSPDTVESLKLTPYEQKEYDRILNMNYLFFNDGELTEEDKSNIEKGLKKVFQKIVVERRKKEGR